MVQEWKTKSKVEPETGSKAKFNTDTKTKIHESLKLLNKGVVEGLRLEILIELLSSLEETSFRP